jgi:hypothetical protein
LVLLSKRVALRRVWQRLEFQQDLLFVASPDLLPSLPEKEFVRGDPRTRMQSGPARRSALRS